MAHSLHPPRIAKDNLRVELQTCKMPPRIIALILQGFREHAVRIE